jgi:mono/diheme cytochrome c family protein
MQKRSSGRLSPGMIILAIFGLALAGLALGTAFSSGSQADPVISKTELIKRGEYLVRLGGCNDCHTPKVMGPNGPEPDQTRLLMGQPANASIPSIPAGVINPKGWMAMTTADMTAWAGPWGISFAANLTPDNVTGIGAWTENAFIKAMRTGKHLGAGRPILPPMPWQAIGKVSDDDLRALFAYLMSIKPISNQVPQPIPPGSSPEMGLKGSSK